MIKSAYLKTNSGKENLPIQPEELASFMDDIFNQMEKKFTNIAHQVLSKIVEMGV
jgi:heat shock factor-binding protein 1